MSLVYIDDLCFDNYKEHLSALRSNLSRIKIYGLLTDYQMANMIGCSKNTLMKFTVKNQDNIAFETAYLFNEFVSRLYEASLDASQT